MICGVLRCGPGFSGALSGWLGLPVLITALAGEPLEPDRVATMIEALTRLGPEKVNANPKLKEALEKVLEATKGTPQFVELMTAAPAGGSECVIELEGKHGKMRIHWKGITASDLAELSRILVMKVPLRTLFTWIARYRKGGDHALREGQRSGRPRKLDAAMMQWLYKAITLGEPRQYQLPFCLWTLALVRLLLKRKYGIELSKSGVSRLLGHLGLSPQRPIYRSYKRNPEDMKRYLDETFPGLRDRARRMGAIIYFVDEASVRSDSHRDTTWGKIGQTPEVEDSGDRFSLKLISNRFCNLTLNRKNVR